MRMLNPISTDWSWPRRSLLSAYLADDFDDFAPIFDESSAMNMVDFHPSCDVTETKDHYILGLDMPGVKKEDIKIEMQGNKLILSGERQHEWKEKNGETTLRHERTYGKFERTFTLPVAIAAEKIEAHYENGVLNVAIPKAETAKSRTIQIQTGEGGFLNKLLGAKTNKEFKDVKVS